MENRGARQVNYWPQNIQKREIVEIQKIKYEYKSENKISSHSIYSKNIPLKG